MASLEDKWVLLSCSNSILFQHFNQPRRFYFNLSPWNDFYQHPTFSSDFLVIAGYSWHKQLSAADWGRLMRMETQTKQWPGPLWMVVEARWGGTTQSEVLGRTIQWMSVQSTEILAQIKRGRWGNSHNSWEYRAFDTGRRLVQKVGISLSFTSLGCPVDAPLMLGLAMWPALSNGTQAGT